MAVMIQDSGNFQKLVGLYENPLLEYWQDKYAEARDPIIDILFDKVKSDNATEAISEMVGGPDFKQWGGEFTYADMKEGNTKVWTPIVFQAGLAYDRFLLSNAKLVNMKTDHGKFAIAAARLLKNSLSGIFTYADQTSYNVNGTTLNWTLTADGLPLASNSHTLSNASATQDNLETLALTETNLEVLCQKMFDSKDESGNYANLNPDTLIVPTALRKTALEIIGGEGKVDTADNNPNVYHGSMKLIVWDGFRRQAGKSGQPWAVIDSLAAKESLKFINRLETGDEYDLISWKQEEIQTWKLGSIMWFSGGAYSYQPFQFSIPA